MMVAPMRHIVFWLFVGVAAAQAPPTRINPAVKNIVDAISQERVSEILKTLESFGTRHTMSPQDDPSHGIGAAKRWIYSQLQSYSPRLQVSYQPFSLKKGGGILRDVDLANIVAVLPGKIDKDRCVLVTAHYDSIDIVRKLKPTEEQRLADLVKNGMDASEAKR